MNNMLEKFLTSIGFDYSEELSSIQIKKVIVNKEKEEFTVYLGSENPLPPSVALSL